MASSAAQMFGLALMYKISEPEEKLGWEAAHWGPSCPVHTVSGHCLEQPGFQPPLLDFG